MHIYRIVNKVNGKTYVGQTVQKLERRWALHKHQSLERNRPLYRAMRKYGVHNFEMSLLETIIDYPSKSVLDEREVFWIKKLNSMVPNGYNLTSGGNGKYYLSEETKSRISVSKKGKPRSEETKIKLSMANLGKPSPRLGAKLSAATRAKISQIQLGKRASEETKRRMSMAKKGKATYNSRKVMCIETGEIFVSASAAAENLNLQQTSISSVCRGIRKSTGGLTFKFID